MKDICIGGHSGTTIVPLLRTTINDKKHSPEDIQDMCSKIRNAGTVVVEAKKGNGSATLSMAAAGFEIVNAILRGLSGEKGVVECAFVKSDITSASYFASPLEFGLSGVERVLPLPELTQQQQDMFDIALPILKDDIQKGLDFPC
ncbi:malate dehydrogenase-like [Octopus sinensis]|uniref:Malate dehydrogenase-like n=1 Tax=Octopus sinensis TaxID=2607531 RepID=A0A6P7TZU7_9MOLL|nr:malate dehydrogenase-like [Octopus sinensis]